MESLDFDEKQKPFYRRKQFWIIVGPLLISLVFVLAVRLLCTLLALAAEPCFPQGACPVPRCAAGTAAAQPRRQDALGWQQAAAPHSGAPGCLLALQGTLYVTLGKSETLSKFEVWRLCYFIAG